MTALKMRVVLNALLAAPMRRANIVEEDRVPWAYMGLVAAITYSILFYLLGSGLGIPFEVLVQITLGSIATIAILFWALRKKQL